MLSWICCTILCFLYSCVIYSLDSLEQLLQHDPPAGINKAFVVLFLITCLLKTLLTQEHSPESSECSEWSVMSSRKTSSRIKISDRQKNQQHCIKKILTLNCYSVVTFFCNVYVWCHIISDSLTTHRATVTFKNGAEFLHYGFLLTLRDY